PRHRRSTSLVHLERLEDRVVPSFGNLSSWQPIGPAPINTGPSSGANTGRIAAIAVDPTTPSTIYVAAASGGVWKSIDGGNSWTPKTDHVPGATTNMGAIAIAPSNPNIIYAGTGEANFDGAGVLPGTGILKSTDGGDSWSLLGQAYFSGNDI